MIGIGLSLTQIAGRGGGASLPVPVLTWVTDGTDNTPTLTFEVPIGVMEENDDWEIEFDNNSDFSSLTDEATGTVNATDAGDGEVEGTLGDALPDGLTYARARVTRGGNPVTAWSNTASQTIDATDVWALEDDSGDWALEDDTGSWILEAN